MLELLNITGAENWRTRRVLPPLAPARQAGKHAVVTRVRNWQKTEGMLPRPFPARSVFEAVPARLSGSSSLNWLPQMDSHHHRRIQSPLSYCWTTRQDSW